MTIPGLKKARSMTRWMKDRLLGGALVLGYHRIADVQSDPYSICVSPTHFEDQLKVLCQRATPISISQLLQGFSQNDLPPGAVVLTFDDGYTDFLTTAKPILEKYEVPATVFFPTGYMGKAFWWDELEQIVTASGTGTSETNDRRASTLEASVHESDTQLLPLYRQLLFLPPRERETTLNKLRTAVSISEMASRAMNEQELVKAASGGLIEIGSHSVTHDLLARLPDDIQRWEIELSKQHLEELLNRSINAFSYPNGSWSRATESKVRHARFSCAFGSHGGLARSTSNRFHLPRFWVKNEGGDRFYSRLRHWIPI